MIFFVFGKFFDFFSESGKKSTFVPKIGGFWRQKRFSDFAQNWLRWGSDDIIFFKFGTFWIPIFPMGKKSNLLWKICIFFSKSLRASGTFFLNQNPYGHLALFFGGEGEKKSCSNLSENWHRWSSDRMTKSVFTHKRENFLMGLKIDFEFFEVGQI